LQPEAAAWLLTFLIYRQEGSAQMPGHTPGIKEI